MNESNIYKEYFLTLKNYLNILEIDKNKILGCNDNSISILQTKYGKLPLAYEEFLRNIGARNLFEFMNAEDMSYDNHEIIYDLYCEVFEGNLDKINANYIPISERHMDYIILIKRDKENPEVCSPKSCYGTNKEIETLHSTFTDMINMFFKQSLNNHSYSFYFVSSNTKNPEKNFKKNISKHIKSLNKIEEIILKYDKDNYLISDLNNIFLNYINKVNSSDNNDYEIEIEQMSPKVYKKNILSKILNYFKLKLQ